MNNDLEILCDNPIFKYFHEISGIPRGSGNEKGISDYLVCFAKTFGLEVIQDEALNVIIKKPATPGYEDLPAVMLQGHMDMVCEKNKDKVHDFMKDGIELKIVDDMLYAENTTLGADNGIALAYSLALLGSNEFQHPPLEVVLTTEEETTFNGVTNLKQQHLSGKILINLDSEEQGKLLVGSAGGVGAKQTFTISWDKPVDGYVSYKIRICGLKGGHSGMAIDKGRGNANKLMGRLLRGLSNDFKYYIGDIKGGSNRNAIPRESEAIIMVKDEICLKDRIYTLSELFKKELKNSDSEVEIKCEKLPDACVQVFSENSKKKVIDSLMLIPDGIQSVNAEINGMVESSTNLGVVRINDKGMIEFISEIRSSEKSLKNKILMNMNELANALDCQFTSFSDYPEWSYNRDSKILKHCEETYYRLNGELPEKIIYHAGIECGVLMEKIQDLDAISIGPDIFDVHNPSEHLSISSTVKTWEYLIEILKGMRHTSSIRIGS